MFLPTSTLTWVIADRWARLNDRPIMAVLRQTLSPVALGLLGAGCYTLFRIAIGDVTSLLIAAAAVLAVGVWKVSPAWAVLGGAIVGIVFLR